MRVASVLLLAALAAAPAGAQELPALYDVTGVAAGDVLNVRAGPDAGSAALGAIAPDATGIEVTAVSGNWGRVNSGDVSGWVAMRYLEARPQAPWWEPSTRLACFGTEPFWSLDIDAEAARFSTPFDEKADWPILSRGASSNRTGVLGLDLDGGFAVIASGECSDGMSDLAYGLTIEVFRSLGDGLGGYSGCCRLGQ